MKERNKIWQQKFFMFVFFLTLSTLLIENIS